MRNNKQYLFWAIALIVLLWLGSELQAILRNYQATYYKSIPYITFTVFFPILVGMFLRLPKYLKEKKSNENFSINWAKLLFLSLPLLFITLSPLYFVLGIPIVTFTWTILFSSSLTITTMSGIIFGYVLVESLREK